MLFESPPSYEAEINIVSYAKKRIYQSYSHPEIEIEAVKSGIPNIEQAMEQGYSTASQQIREMGLGDAHGTSQYQFLL